MSDTLAIIVDARYADEIIRLANETAGDDIFFTNPCASRGKCAVMASEYHAGQGEHTDWIAKCLSDAMTVISDRYDL